MMIELNVFLTSKIGKYLAGGYLIQDAEGARAVSNGGDVLLRRRV